MSSFNCEYCGTAIIDTPSGYITSCEHHKEENMDCHCHAGKICKVCEPAVMEKLNSLAESQVDIPKEFKDVLTNWNYQESQGMSIMEKLNNLAKDKEAAERLNERFKDRKPPVDWLDDLVVGRD